MKNKRGNGGIARAKKLTPEQRKAIAAKGADARWGGKPGKKAAQHRNSIEAVTDAQIDAVVRKAYQRADLRDEIAMAVLTGLYSNIAESQKFVQFVYGGTMPLPEGLTRIAYAQADETLRLRSL